MSTKTIEQRFWEKVRKTKRCWLWTAATTNRGYGVLGVGRGLIRATHFSWIIHKGHIPKGFWVLHKCDNPVCVRPDHLFLGRRQDNVDDMVCKNRQAIGEMHGQSKLPERRVKRIRQLYKSGKVSGGYTGLARRFGVCRLTIKNIVHRRTWKHI